MDPEEVELHNDYRYRNYAAVIEKALRNFESSSEWADLISSLGKLNKALQSNLRYSLLPKRLIIGKRLAQCLHPALPSGVHLKALETYEVIFKIIGTKWLAKDLFIYSSGLFPLLGHAAMAVKPVLLTLYERYYLPLQRALLPSLQAFITGLLPGLEEGLEVYDRTDALLVKLSLLVGQQVFYGALWGSMLVTPMVRLPASVFVVTHFDRMAPLSQQTHMLGYSHCGVMKSVCLSLQDSNVLVQRNMLEVLLYFFPFATCLDPAEPSVALSVEDMITVVSAALLTLLRRDMSLNRRLYAWLLGTDIKGGMVAPHPTLSATIEEHTSFYFDTYSKDFLVKALINILKQKEAEGDPKSVIHYLKPFRILISLLDKPEIGPPVLSCVLLEVVRAFPRYCLEVLEEENPPNSRLSGNQLSSKMKENKNASEIIKTVNMLVSSMNSEYLWEYMTQRFCSSLSETTDPPPEQEYSDPALSVTEVSSLITFLLDVLPLELHADIQSHFLPDMLDTMLQALCRHMDSVCLEDVTQGLRACFKVLSKIQMPVAYMEVEAAVHTEEMEIQSPEEKTTKTQGLQNGGEKDSVNGHHEDEQERRDGGGEEEPADGVYPALRSEDSGLGISASPSEQHLSLEVTAGAEQNGKSKTSEGVWRRGGGVDTMTQCLQDILAFITTRCLMVQVEDVRGPDPEPQPDMSPTSVDQKSLLGGREIKVKLTELFTQNKRKAHASPDAQLPASPTEMKKGLLAARCLDWTAGYMPRGRAEVSEACRQAFVATCHLLLESTTFPVYLSEEEMLALHTDMFGNAGGDVDSLPVWLRSLMILCCMSRDHNIQHTALASLLELINHSQSLALVIQDKQKRYQSSRSNPLNGRLQMATVPPIYPVLLCAIEDSTDFYQRVSKVLWNQLDTEQREQHVSCVDLFYRLHCLAPSASICEDIICQALLHKDKAVRLEALHRFTVLWHLTREIQSNRTMSLCRSFDRSLCVVVDSLSSTDGSISAASHRWLVRALSLNDVIRILEPILLLLLHPSTQRCSIQSIKQNLTAGNLKDLNTRSRSSTKTSRTSNDNVTTDVATLNILNVVDREALWAELDSGPELPKPPEDLVISRSESEETEEEEAQEEEEEEEEEPKSEHTESADTSGAQVSTENSSSGSALPSSVEEGGLVNGLRRVESEHTQASESLSSEDEEDLELEASARSRQLEHERKKREAIDSLFRHVLLYPAAGGWRHLLQGLALLDSLLRSSAECPLVDALCSTSLDTSSAAHLNLISNLLQRHQQAQDGKGFYGGLLSPTSSPSVPPSLLIELLVSLCLRFLRSHYPSYLSLTPLDLQGNREVQVKSVSVLTQIVNQLGCMARRQEGSRASLESIHKLLSSCKVQQNALLSLSASMYTSQRGTEKGSSNGVELLDEQGGLSEESLLFLGPGGGREQYPLQIELLKLLQALVVLEYHVWPGGVVSAAGGANGQPGDSRESSPATTLLAREWQTAVLFQQSIKAAQYVPSHPITAQGMFVSAAARALQPQYGYAMHPHWVSLLCSSLPYLGRSLGIIVAPLINQICRNLDELVKLHEHDGGKANQSLIGRRENIAPDYALTLLEGLTSITHFCLLDNKKSLVTSDPMDVRNARNAVLETLPHMLSSMALLWAVVTKEEGQRRASDSAQSSRHISTSVYFKCTKILRQRILEFLFPLTGHYGVQLLASVGVVWNSRRSKRRHKNKVLPVASESRLVIVELVKSLNTLNTENILQLVKEVVKRPHQIRGEQKSILVDIPVLQFSYAYIQSIPAQALQENVASLLSLLRESVQLNMAPPGHFLLLGILNDFVNRLPNLDSKKDTKDLQEVTQKILEAVSGIAGSSLEQTSWLSRSLEVKVQPQVCPEAEEPDDADVDGDHCESVNQANAMVSSSAPSVYSVQALKLLAEILAPLLDMVYRSDEKEKAVPLISRLLYYVFPYLKNHSAYNMPSFEAGAQLLSSLSGYAYTKRAWKKEVFELFMDPLFFTMDASCAHNWKSIIDHLLTHEKTMFKDLLGMQSSSLKLFSSVEQKPMLLKRQAFSMFSGELDQYHLYLPLIQERLTEALRTNSSPAVFAQMFLMFRVLLLRISPQHLTSLWPIMVTELIHTFARLEKALQADKNVSKLAKVVHGALDKNRPVNFSQAELDMYLSACKFLDTSLAFPPERMPLFQMYRWAFVPEVDVNRYGGPESTLIEGEQECTPHVVRVLEGIQQRYGALNELSEESSTEHLVFPLLTQRSLSSITQLLPFLRILCCLFQAPPPSWSQHDAHFPVADYPAASSHAVLRKLEDIIENDFLDPMES